MCIRNKAEKINNKNEFLSQVQGLPKWMTFSLFSHTLDIKMCVRIMFTYPIVAQHFQSNKTYTRTQSIVSYSI